MAATPRTAPLPLLSYERGVLAVGDEAARYLSTLSVPTALVCVAGPTRTGKSFLANQLVASVGASHASGGAIESRSGAFEVRAGLYACTSGVWLWPSPQYVDVPCARSNGERESVRVALLMLDCQGVRDEETDRLFCVAAALSCAIVYSTLGAIDEAQLELIAALFSDATLPPRSPTLFHPRTPPVAEAASAYLHSPLFVWALRDFSLALRDGHGNPLSPAQYLEAALGAGAATDARPAALGGRTGALLRRLLPRRDCVPMPRPVSDELLHNMARVPASALRPKWSHAVSELRTKIVDGLSASSTLPVAWAHEGTGGGMPPWSVDGATLIVAARAAAHALSTPSGGRGSVPLAASACAAAAARHLRQRALEQATLVTGAPELAVAASPSLTPSRLPRTPHTSSRRSQPLTSHQATPHAQLAADATSAPAVTADATTGAAALAAAYGSNAVAMSGAGSPLRDGGVLSASPQQALLHVVAPSELQLQADDKLVRHTALHYVLSAPEASGLRSARASLSAAHAAAVRFALRRLLRYADLAHLLHAMRLWLSGAARVREEALRASVAAKSPAAAGDVQHDVMAEVAALRARAADSVAQAETVEAQRQRDAEISRAEYADLNSSFIEQAARLAAAEKVKRVSIVQAVAKSDEQLHAAQRRGELVALRGLLCTAREREDHDAMRRAMSLWHWGVAAQAARYEWHRQLCAPRLLLLRRLAAGERQTAMRQLLRRWHSTIVVAAVDRTLVELHGAHCLVKAARHAHAVSILSASERRAHAAALAHAIGTWTHAALASTRMRLASMQPKLIDAADEAHAAAAEIALDAVDAEERVRDLEAQLEDARGQLDTERRRAAQQMAYQQEETDEVCRAAAAECARTREAASAARSSAAIDQRALSHWCAAVVVQSCMRAHSLAAASHAIGRWRWAVAQMKTAEQTRVDDAAEAPTVPPTPAPSATPSVATREEERPAPPSRWWTGGSWRRKAEPISPSAAAGASVEPAERDSDHDSDPPAASDFLPSFF